MTGANAGSPGNSTELSQHETQILNITYYKGSGRGGLPAPPSSVVGNALVVIDDGIDREVEREEPLQRGTRLSTEGKP